MPFHHLLPAVGAAGDADIDGRSTDVPSSLRLQLIVRAALGAAVSVVTWNCQALFAADPLRHRRKAQHVNRLMRTHDVGLWTETHGTQGSCDVWRNPPGCTSWWSPGHVAGSAGVGITVKNSFLRQFTDSPRWKIILRGRAAVLQLRGPGGALDLVVTYFHTGAAMAQHDIDAAGLLHLHRAPTAAELREALRRRLAQQITHQDAALTILGGDFNYVAEVADRRCATTAVATGGRDRGEQASWQRQLALPHGLHELHQPDMSYASPTSRSGDDRLYCKQAATESLDRAMTCVALDWCPKLSRHRAISYRREVPRRTQGDHAPLPDQVIEHPEWPRLVALAWQDLLKDDPGGSSLKQLALLKAAMRRAARSLNYTFGSSADALTHEDKQGMTMKFLRSSERGSATGISQCILRYPVPTDLVDNPYDFSLGHGRRLRLVRQHSVELARSRAIDEFSQLHNDLHDLTPDQAARRRQRNHRLLTRLAPGRGCSHYAVRDHAGHVSTDPSHVTKALEDHWAGVFSRKDTDRRLRQEWLADEAAHFRPADRRHVPGGVAPFECFQQAIAHTKKSSPGPDGIPFRAWQRLGTFAARALYDAFLSMVSPGGLDSMEMDWNDFSESSMVILPKKPTAANSQGLEFFSIQRAYADDLAMTLAHGTRGAPVLERAFDECERLAGLRLRRGKTVWAPLSLALVAVARASLQAAAPTWGEFAVRRRAAYLGFEVGRERGELSWAKPLEKYIERARTWRAIGGGMFLTMLAYRI
ncbi:unnamed protein product [Prorocentrum cordatum]|uniref:Endonuclease/exonuclease/phosphatase domain-containing protein n=1 Tax=Prorocentrum cordatum TaxID=2364126 RepID=A0ABN9TZA4_9DINO|nr:unnamed protein product [Polarella glacialis]